MDSVKKAFVIREMFMACALSGIVGVFGFSRVVLFSLLVSMPETVAITFALMAIVLISVVLGALLPLSFQLLAWIRPTRRPPSR